MQGKFSVLPDPSHDPRQGPRVDVALKCGTHVNFVNHSMHLMSWIIK